MHITFVLTEAARLERWLPSRKISHFQPLQALGFAFTLKGEHSDLIPNHGR